MCPAPPRHPQAIYNIALNADADVTDDGATPLSPYLMTLFVSVMHRADKCVGSHWVGG